MNRHAALAALVVAALGTLLLALYLRRFEDEKSGGEPVKVLVATKALAAGAKITEDVLGVRVIPIAYVDGRSVKATERDKVVGLRTRASLDVHDPLLWNDLAISAEEHRDLSSLIMPGFRAVYLQAVHDEQGARLIGAGDYVDVIATLPGGDGRPEGERAVVLLQRALVLASGNRFSPEDSSPGTDRQATASSSGEQSALTLSLSLQDAQRIALATERGHFSVVLRNPADPHTVDEIPEMTDAVLAEGHVRSGAIGRRSAPPIALKAAAVVGDPR